MVNASRINHLYECFSSACSSHFRMIQKAMAVMSDDMAYTSPSVVENQNVSLNVYAREPMNAAAKMVYVFPCVI